MQVLTYTRKYIEPKWVINLDMSVTFSNYLYPNSYSLIFNILYKYVFI